MNRVVILFLVLFPVMVYSVDNNLDLNLASDDASMERGGLFLLSDLHNDCYTLINDKKYKEALSKANLFKNIHDKVTIYISVGMASSDKELGKEIVSSLMSFQSQEEGLDYISNQINQIEYMHMTVSEKLMFIKAQKDLDSIFSLLGSNHDVLFLPNNAVVVYDTILKLAPKKPLEMELQNILSILLYVRHDSLTKKEKNISSFVFKKSKKLDLDSQLNILVELMNIFPQESREYVSRIRTLYNDAEEVLDQLMVATKVCYNKHLPLLTRSEYDSLEARAQIQLQSNRLDYRYLYGLIGLAQCQGDRKKMSHLISRLPKDQQSRYDGSPDG